jgi:hypothetical protein
MTIKANFSDTGVDVGLGANNMTYLYGLSDFFNVMFEDTSTVNLFLEAETEVAAEIYSRFLQYTSTLSLEGIQESISSTIKLVLLSSNEAIPDYPNAYLLPENIQSTDYIANRAFLPTELLDNGVDYFITQREDGRCIIRFAHSLDHYALPVRVVGEPKVEQRAMWFVNAVVDENLVSTFYGNLIGITPGNASAQFSDFVYGLFYVYMHGPKLDTLSRGLNLVLGIPMAREQEQVLSIRTYLETDQYLVICDQNQYVIPYGLAPSVQEGDMLNVGDPLAQWVEIKDYEHDGEWWVNLYLPKKLIPQIPDGQKDRYATPGSHFDYLMRNYLKTHTFMVRVKIANFKNLQQFVQISDIIKRAKPCYTEAIYIWTLTDGEHINPHELLSRRFDANWDDSFKVCISRLRRDNLDDPLIRGKRSFIRFNVDHRVEQLCGTDAYANVYNTRFGGDQITGFVNPVSQFRTNTEMEKGWIRAVLNRGHNSYHGFRHKIGFHRGAAAPADGDGNPVHVESTNWQVDHSFRMVPLYITTTYDIQNKAAKAGLPDIALSSWWFELFSPRSSQQSVNDIAINFLPPTYDPSGAVKHYDSFFFRSTDVTYLGREFPDHTWDWTWAPQQRDIRDGDYLLCIKITPTVLGVYWVTSNFDAALPPYFPVGEIDPLLITYTGPMSRGGGLNKAPLYVMRGAGALDYNTVDAAIDSVAINEFEGSGGLVAPASYQDKYNSAMPIDRSGVRLKHAVESF